MVNKDNMDIPEALAELYVTTFNAVHSGQESWATRDYVQKDVWKRMIDNCVMKLMEEPGFWRAVAVNLDPEINHTRGALLSSPVGDRVSGSMRNGLRADPDIASLLEQLHAVQKENTILLRQIVTNTDPIRVSRRGGVW